LHLVQLETLALILKPGLPLFTKMSRGLVSLLKPLGIFFQNTKRVNLSFHALLSGEVQNLPFK